MILRRELPHIRAVMRDDLSLAFPCDEYDSILAAWTAGKAFWTGIDLWGQTVTVKLATVMAILYKTEDSLDLGLLEEEEEERRRTMINGDSA